MQRYKIYKVNLFLPHLNYSFYSLWSREISAPNVKCHSKLARMLTLQIMAAQFVSPMNMYHLLYIVSFKCHIY